MTDRLLIKNFRTCRFRKASTRLGKPQCKGAIASQTEKKHDMAPYVFILFCIQIPSCFAIKDSYDKNFCVGKTPGLHADPEDCRAYYDCVKEKTFYHGPLTAGKMFNPDTKLFVNSWEMKCPVHKVIRELWTDVYGYHVTDLVSSRWFPCAPDKTEFIDAFCLYRRDSGYHYGQRLRSFFRAPETGNYTFQTSCDDSCQLWISDNEQPQRKRMVIHQQKPVILYQWGRQDQISENLHLKEGHAYYMEVIHKQELSNGFMCVGVNFPSSFQQRPLSSRHLVMGTTELNYTGCKGLGGKLQGVTCRTNACASPESKLKVFRTSMQGMIIALDSIPSDESSSSLRKITEVTEEAARSVHYILEAENKNDWRKTNETLAMEIAKETELFGKKLAEKWVNESSAIGSSEPNVVLQVAVYTKGYSFSAPGHDPNWNGIDDSLSVRDAGRLSGTKTRIFSVMYRSLHEMLPQHPAKVQTFPRESGDEQIQDIYKINSRVIGSLFTSTDKHGDIEVTVILSHIKHIPNATLVPTCVWWNFTTGRENGSGVWSTKGCSLDVTSSNETHSVCRCNHLTNFAVLMRVTPNDKSMETHSAALQIITYIGCTLSLLGVMLTVIIITCLSGLRSERNLIHLNLSLAIGIFQIIFLSGIEATNNQVACTLVAVLLHYFLLVSFAWMLVEGVHLYIMVVTVFESNKEQLRIYGACAYGVPGVIVLIAASVAHKGYGTDSTCWLSVANGVIYAFVSPALAIIVINTIILVMVIKEIITIQTNGVTQSTKFDLVKSGVKSAVVLFPLLGVTWVFGILALDSKTIVFQYLFAVFNSLQGFFIFVFHCLLNSEIQREIRRKREVWTSRRSNLFPLSAVIPSGRKKTASTVEISSKEAPKLQDGALVSISEDPETCTQRDKRAQDKVSVSFSDINNGQRVSPGWLGGTKQPLPRTAKTKHPIKLPPVTSSRDTNRQNKRRTKKTLRQSSKSKVNATMGPDQDKSK